MDRGRGGIQHLLAAEQEANRIVDDARNVKMGRLKQAKQETDNEVAEYRVQMESRFQRRLAEGTGYSNSNVKRLEKETETKVDQLKMESTRVSRDVVDMLLKHVTTVRV